MTALFVVLIVLAVLILLSLLRFGAEIGYDTDGVRVDAKVLLFRFRVFPSKLTEEEKAEKESKKKAKAAKKAAKKPPEPKKVEKKGGPLPLLLSMLPDLAHAAGKLLRKIRIDRLEVRLVWGANNPADAAIGYGRASAAMGTLWGLIEPNFKVKKRELTCDVDFDAPSPAVTLRAAVTITLGQVIAVAAPLLFQFLKAKSNQPEAHNLTKEA